MCFRHRPPRETAAETSSTELIKTYINKIYQRFLVDPLFLYELEAVSKNKSDPTCAF